MLQAWKVEDFLAKWEGTCSGTNAADAGRAAIALVLLKEIDAYRLVAKHVRLGMCCEASSKMQLSISARSCWPLRTWLGCSSSLLHNVAEC